MKIEVLQNNPYLLDYLERKVNNGLLGGTKYLNNVSMRYNPYYCCKMNIPYIICSNIKEYGCDISKVMNSEAMNLKSL